MMKQSLYAFFVVIALVMPVLSYAAPCNAAMLQASAMQTSASMGEQPCPHHKQQAAKPCDGLTSVADCLDMGLITSGEAAGLKVTKSDLGPVAAAPLYAEEGAVPIIIAPRAPPATRAFRVSSLSLILTTQRFRV
jgi:hypothetical protein